MPKVGTQNSRVWFDVVTAVRTSSEGALYALGQYREEDGKGYRYVKYNNGTGNLTLAAGYLLYIKDAATDPWEMTMDVSDTTTNAVRGVAVSVIADGGFGWMQTKGYNAAVETDAGDDFAAGDAAIAHATEDGEADRTAKGTAPVSRVVGWAMAADVDADDTVALDLVLD